MSQFPPRNPYSNKIPDRGISSTFPTQAREGPFGQSAPSFGRRQESAQQNTYVGFSQGAQTQPTTQPPSQPAAQAHTHAQHLAPTGPSYRPPIEKDPNILNDLSDEQRDEINEAFTLFDLDRDRHLDYHELRVALRALGFTPHKNEVMALMTANGVPKPTAQRVATARQPLQSIPQTYHPAQLLIPQNSFSRIAAQKMLERDPREEVERAFYLFDMDRKDYINLDDLRRVTRELGETSLEEQELQNMIEEFDYEGIGGVSKDAFFGICLQ